MLHILRRRYSTANPSSLINPSPPYTRRNIHVHIPIHTHSRSLHFLCYCPSASPFPSHFPPFLSHLRKVRARAMGLAMAANRFTAFIIAMTFLSFSESVGAGFYSADHCPTSLSFFHAVTHSQALISSLTPSFACFYDGAVTTLQTHPLAHPFTDSLSFSY